MARRHKASLALLAVAAVPLLLLALFALNGAVICDGATPCSGTTESAVAVQQARSEAIRLMAFNIAKCFIYKGGRDFANRASVESHLGAIADIIRSANPDVVCLSEIVRECGPCNVDQVQYLAKHTALTNWAFGECFSFGFPFYRCVSGNAIISRYPIHPLANVGLAGRKPFYITKNNRRALACEVAMPDGDHTVWSLHNDSFSLSNNLQQVRQLLARPESAGAFMAGDFNARPTDLSMLTFQRSGRFTGVFDGPYTFPAQTPTRTIDFVLAPVGYSVVEHTVITNAASDHCAVVTTFERDGKASNKTSGHVR